MKDEALRLALVALERADKISGYPNHKKTIAKIKQALDKKAENARELGLDYKTEDEARGNK